MYKYFKLLHRGDVCQPSQHVSLCKKCFQTAYHTMPTCPQSSDVFLPPIHPHMSPTFPHCLGLQNWVLNCILCPLNASKGMWDNYNLRQEITLENLFVLFIFCQPADNFDGNGNGTPVITVYNIRLLLVFYTFQWSNMFSGTNYIWKSGAACNNNDHHHHHHHVLTLRRLMSYIYGAPILDVSRSHTTTQHSR